MKLWVLGTFAFFTIIQLNRYIVYDIEDFISEGSSIKIINLLIYIYLSMFCMEDLKFVNSKQSKHSGEL